MPWPEPNDDAAYLFIDHREEETAVIDSISVYLKPEDELEVIQTEAGGLVVRHQGRDLELPLTGTPHDRYVAISSVAALLDGRYQVFLEKGSLQSDTHALLFVAKEDAEAFGPPPPHLVSLKLGKDYFSASRELPEGIDIPYADTPMPAFAEQSRRVAGERMAGAAITEAMLAALMGGTADAAKLKAAVAALRQDPKYAAEFAGKTDDEIVAEFTKALGQAVADPEVKAQRDEMTRGLDQIRTMTGLPPLTPAAPRKPWWKFW